MFLTDKLNKPHDYQLALVRQNSKTKKY